MGSTPEDRRLSRPDSPFPDTMNSLRTPSIDYNHGGLYAPADPKTCTMPGGPCEYCQERIDAEAVADALVALSQSCPECDAPGCVVTHASRGHKTCNGCPDKLCIRCFFGARYYCPLRNTLPPPSSPPMRQAAVGVQSPKAEEKGENK